MSSYLIVGQGLAGSILAYSLTQKGHQVCILNDNSLPSASKISAGVFNPFAGKRLLRTWMIDQIFPYAQEFYSQLEIKFNTKLVYNAGIYRPFESVQEQNTFWAKTSDPDIAKYVSTDFDEQKYEAIHQQFGGLEFTYAGWIDTPKVLELIMDFYQQRGAYLDECFDFKNINIQSDGVFYENTFYDKIIFCEGFQACQNPYFNWLPFNPVKGQTLTIQIEDYNITEIVNRGLWVLPTNNAGQCRVGATYSWDQLDWEITEEGRSELVQKLEGLIKRPYTILLQQAGIRPATDDRRPFVGLHPEHTQLGIFNGLGTKGVTLAPFFAAQLADFLTYNNILDESVNIERYFSLYYRSKK
jgi:glycine/D-amino acid oxidase-like deaminating enzyme